MTEFHKGVRQLGARALDFVYPPTCLACDAPIAAAGALCVTCFRRLRAITAPMCPVLGLPFTVDFGSGTRSIEAIVEPPPFARARSAVIYNDVAATLVARFKYGDRPEFATFLARMTAGAGGELWGGDAVLAPIPLHWSRLIARRYNQAAELARALERLVGVPLTPRLLRRRRPTRQQVGLSASARRRNLVGALWADPKVADRLDGRRVIIVDDVITTGATVRAAARALLAAGVAAVDVVSFARVVADEPA